jgi:hypothetical protein
MDPIEDGEKYYFTHGFEYRNPHPRGTDKHNQFEREWSQALKKRPEVGARIDKKRKEENERRYESESRKSGTTAEDYRNAKGK